MTYAAEEKHKEVERTASDSKRVMSYLALLQNTGELSSTFSKLQKCCFLNMHDKLLAVTYLCLDAEWDRSSKRAF